MLPDNQKFIAVIVFCLIQGDQGPRGQFGMMGRKGSRVSTFFKVAKNKEKINVIIGSKDVYIGMLSYEKEFN